MKKLFLFFGLSVSLGSLVFIKHSQAFTLISDLVAFEPDVVKVDYNLDSCRSAFSEQALRDLIQTAVDKSWNRVPYSRLQLQVGSDAPSAGTDRIIMICDSAWASTEVGGIGGPASITGDRIVSGEFTVNTNPNLDNNVQGRPDATKQRLVAHEIGHTIGLGHTDATGNLMSGDYSVREIGLGEDDIAGVQFLYSDTEGAFGCSALASTKEQQTIMGSAKWIGFLEMCLPILLAYFGIVAIRRKREF